MSGLGTPGRVDELIERYPGLHAGVFANETDALLASLLIEQRAERMGTDPTVGQDARDPDEVGGRYAEIIDSLNAGRGWVQYQPGFVSSEIDLRVQEDPLEEDVLVAFTREQPGAPANVANPADLGEPRDIVRYFPGEFPVTGIQVRTGNIWVRVPSDATKEVSLRMEVWG